MQHGLTNYSYLIVVNRFASAPAEQAMADTSTLHSIDSYSSPERRFSFNVPSPIFRVNQDKGLV